MQYREWPVYIPTSEISDMDLQFWLTARWGVSMSYLFKHLK